MNAPRRKRDDVASGRLAIRRSREILEYMSRMGRAGLVAAMLVYQHNILRARLWLLHRRSAKGAFCCHAGTAGQSFYMDQVPELAIGG